MINKICKSTAVVMLILMIGNTACKSPERLYLGDNSRTSLDWNGIYEGFLPCADCEGIKTIITLFEDNTFTKADIYLKNGEEHRFDSKGKFKWNKNGSIITLNSRDLPLKYQVGENHLRQLDIDGNKIEGVLADMYILHKKDI